MICLNNVSHSKLILFLVYINIMKIPSMSGIILEDYKKFFKLDRKYNNFNFRMFERIRIFI